MCLTSLITGTGNIASLNLTEIHKRGFRRETSKTTCIVLIVLASLFALYLIPSLYIRVQNQSDYFAELSFL